MLTTESTMSIFNLLTQADIVVKVVMVLLVCASVIGWAIILNKVISFSKIKKKMYNFEKLFLAGQNIDLMVKQVARNQENHPLAYVLTGAIEELNIKYNENNLKERINNTMQVISNRTISNMETNISYLATIGSVSPFVGLFGTVWGIMSSFQSLTAVKSSTIASVAPGIAEALLATAFGLIAAIPAVIFYNKFTRDLDEISRRTNDFCLELSTVILRESK